jgi:predicted amidophosphoribosyltransferase
MKRESVSSYSALYLGVGPGYRLLRQWKRTHGPILDREVLKRAHLKLPDFDWVVPVPQALGRAMALGGSPAERLARWISAESGRGIEHAFEWPSKKRQAQLGKQGRFENELRFSLREDAGAQLAGQRVLLVDDFMTTGRTLAKAADVLHAAGTSEVHAWVLGTRPQFGGSHPGRALIESAQSAR